MNSVAVKSVATIMSNHYSQEKKQMPTKDFDAVFKKAQDIVGHQRQEPRVQVPSKPQVVDEKERPSDEQKVETASDTSQTKVSKEKSTEPESEEIKEVEGVVLKKLASSLGISEEELSEMMAALNLTLIDLFSNNGLQTLFTEAFGLDNEVELLKNPIAFEAFKEIKNMVNQVMKEELEERNIVPEDFIRQMEIMNQKEEVVSNISNANNASVSQSQTTTSVQTNAQTSVNANQGDRQGVTVEVIDQREKVASTQEPQITQVPEAKDAKSEGKESKNDSSNQQQFGNILQQTVTHKVEVVTAQGIKEMIYQTNGSKEIVDQIVTGMKVAVSDTDTTMTFQLKPENLGKVAFSISSQNGVLTGHFVAESSAAKEAIEANLVVLKTTLSDQGIKLDEVKVVIGNTNQFFEQKDQSKNFNHFAKNKRRRLLEEDVVEGVGSKIIDLKETIRNEELESQEHRVDYSA